ARRRVRLAPHGGPRPERTCSRQPRPGTWTGGGPGSWLQRPGPPPHSRMRLRPRVRTGRVPGPGPGEVPGRGRSGPVLDPDLGFGSENARIPDLTTSGLRFRIRDLQLRIRERTRHDDRLRVPVARRAAREA